MGYSTLLAYGNLTEKPEIKTVQTAKGERKVANVTIGVNRKNNETTFLRFAVWGANTNALIQRSKGDCIGLEGSPRIGKYEDKNGNKRRKVETTANRVHLLPRGARMSMSSHTAMGNVVREPESKGGAARFSIAVNQVQNGVKTTEYIDCVGFAKNAETIMAHLKKGMAVHVKGRLDVSTYAKNDGTKGDSISLILDNMGGLSIAWPGREQATGSLNTTGSNSDDSELDEEIPF